jgi:hypothetical protein
VDPDPGGKKSPHISAHFRLTVSLLDKLIRPVIYHHSSYEDRAYGHVGIRKNWVFFQPKDLLWIEE